MKKSTLLLIALLLIAGNSFSQNIRATTEDGRSVMLQKSGKWFFVDRSPLTECKAVIYDGRAVKLEKNGLWSSLNNKEPVPVPTNVNARYTPSPSLNSGGKSFTGINLHPFLASNTTEIATVDGAPADQRRITMKQYVLVYFSALWCGPCQKFTPDLVQFYNRNGGGSKFEIVFVSSDHTGRAMIKYMNEMQMPWIGVRWKSQGAVAISKKYSGSGIPCLVLLNGNDQVLSHSYVGEEYVGPQQVLSDLENILRQ